MEDVVRECRARSTSAARVHRVADAALYEEVAARAEEVMAREAELGYARRTATADEVRRLRELKRRGAWESILWAALLGAFLFGVILLGTGCASAPRGASLDAYVGGSAPTSRGRNDVGDVGAYGIVGVSGHAGTGEWFLEVGRAQGEADAGDIGIFDLDATVVRGGAGLHLGTMRALGLDWSAGLGACVTVVDGTASAGSLSRSVSESGVGWYSAGEVGRGPVFLRATYVDGPTADVDGEDVELGGLSVVGGLRWTL